MKRKSTPANDQDAWPPEVRPGQSLELLKALHILTREGKLNQDARRKLKQVYHLFQFIEKPLLAMLPTSSHKATPVRWSWPTTARANRIWASSSTTCFSSRKRCCSRARWGR
jgi:hypothetical protein